ncbi:death domain-containing protein CRADD isoform X2 [Mastacembelus armatus]|uniref:CASP2 and RIPK1 domain containing adaptor with death domain n=1 Tax=Mastacembelus armatus TaxID=205130 RepID=A0A3Q3NER2_9TELE|nr:death domain-containing protein CRADD-like isoform X2 [Mastacembelus armatus]
MDPVHKALLRKHRLDLSGQLLVSDTVVPFLFQENILTDAQVEDIECQPTDRQKVLKLLDILPNRGPRAFHLFLRSLGDFGWVRDQLLQELQTPPGPSCADVCRIPDSVLQRVPSDRELSRLASRLGPEWESVLMDLGLSAEAVFRCRSDHCLSAHGAALGGLVQWRRAEGRKATVERLLQSLQATGHHPSVLEDVLV